MYLGFGSALDANVQTVTPNTPLAQGTELVVKRMRPFLYNTLEFLSFLLAACL